MTGSWAHRAGEDTVQETWIGPAGGTMAGANLTAGTRSDFEFMRIADTGDGVSFFASPRGRPAVEFPLKELAPRHMEWRFIRQ